MDKNIIFVFAMFLSILIPSQVVFAQKQVPIRCSGCHERLSAVLPSSHKNYKGDNLSLCFSCHKTDGKKTLLGEKIHVSHLQKEPDTMKDCVSCHIANKDGEVTFPSYPNMKEDKSRMQTILPFFNSWMSSSYLDNNHMKKGVYCLDCHTTYLDEFEVFETQERCIKCHGNYDELIKLTAKAPYGNNPHKSHYVDLKCNVCHHGHKEFTNFCAKCH